MHGFLWRTSWTSTFNYINLNIDIPLGTNILFKKKESCFVNWAILNCLELILTDDICRWNSWFVGFDRKPRPVIHPFIRFKDEFLFYFGRDCSFGCLLTFNRDFIKSLKLNILCKVPGNAVKRNLKTRVSCKDFVELFRNTTYDCCKIKHERKDNLLAKRKKVPKRR